LDYLLKPVSKDRLLKTIERLEKYREEHKKIAIPTTNHLNINVCSDLTFYLSDKEHVVDWRTAKSKELFLYLLLNKDRMVHKSLLVDLLWEDLDLERALQLLYTTIYHIRRALKPFNNYLKIINKSETYMLTTSKSTIDLKEWESKLDSLTIIEDH